MPNMSLTTSGNFNNLNKYLLKIKGGVNETLLEKYGELGVHALASNTPIDTGETANAWYYTITRSKNNKVALNFCNSNIQNGCPIAIILQYGHATKNGGWVEGIDYINPVLKPIFDKLAEEAWREVTSK